MRKKGLLWLVFGMALVALGGSAVVAAKPKKATIPGEIINVTFNLHDEPDVYGDLTLDSMTLYIGKFYDGQTTCYVNLKSQEFSCVGK